ARPMDVEAPAPHRIEVETAVRLQVPAELLVVRSIAVLVALVDIGAARLHPEPAGAGQLPILSRNDDPLLAGEGGREGEVPAGRDGPVIGRRQAQAEVAGRAEARRKQATAPLHGRIGMTE